ncbi:MAG TPA: hypothetical protein VFA39_13980 [Steroidobacteraceae bacterium]|nr:hypothetical protein [Steroidobacteraceae bacterium]
MPHTYLFQPAHWTGTGTFWCADGQPLPAECRTEVAHRTECWLLSGTLKVLGSPPVEFVNAYQIDPPGKDGTALKWSSESATLGKLHGTFSVIGTAITSVYRCESSGYHGAEHYRRIDDDTYESAGVLLLEDRQLSSWQVLIRRAPMTSKASD